MCRPRRAPNRLSTTAAPGSIGRRHRKSVCEDSKRYKRRSKCRPTRLLQATARLRWCSRLIAIAAPCLTSDVTHELFGMTNLAQTSALVRWVRPGVLLVLWLMLMAEVRALDFIYTNIDGTITITGYTGPGGN